MHVLPRVRELEHRYADVLTVIGVHTGKFVTERVTERIAEACDRLDVVHAVVNDRQYRVWRDYAVSAWPTLALIDAEGYISYKGAGEVPLHTLSEQVERAAARARRRGTLVQGVDPTHPHLMRHEGTLRFPTRAVLVKDRLWVSDTGHERVLECQWDGRWAAATVLAEHRGFVEPRGIAVRDGAVFVADRAAHSIFVLNGAGEPERIAGTGQMNERDVRAGAALGHGLRSPWGLSATPSGLAVAMAGAHQLWHLDTTTGRLELLAGNGFEQIADGFGARAALAQPTGLAGMSGGRLAFADCETSAVRTLDGQEVRTLVGVDLFKFGDRPGSGDDALLQHCEDVATYEARLAVADTYNDRLKALDPRTRRCEPWPGEAGEEGALREPGGVSADGDTLLVADTGHHRIVSVGRDGGLREVRFG